MLQLDYSNKFYICGSIKHVLIRLKEMEKEFKTVREFLDFQFKE